MKVAIVGPVYPYRGGIVHHTMRLAETLAGRHEVRILSFRRQYPRLLYPGKSDLDPSRSRTAQSTEFLLDPLLPPTWLRAASVLRADLPELVVIQWWTTFWAPAFATLAQLMRRRKVVVLFLVHNVLPHEPSVVDKGLASLALRQGNALISQSTRERTRLVSLLPKSATYVAPFPRFDHFDASACRREEARRMLKLPETATVLLYFGLVRPYKGLRYLIDAVALLRQAQRNVYLIISGEFWESEAAYREQISSAQLSEYVRLENRYVPDEEVPCLFAAADVFVAPYVGGTQSAALQTALYFGLPCVATERIVGDVRGQTVEGLMHIVPSADAAALADAICRASRATRLTAPIDVRQDWEALAACIEEVWRKHRARE